MRKKIRKRRYALVQAVLMILTAALQLPAAIVHGAPRENWEDGILEEDRVNEKRAIWMDASKSVDERVDALLAVMTLEEKAAQMVQPEQNSSAAPELVKELGIGSILSGGGSAPPGGNSAFDWADRVREYKVAALESRLGIPLIYGVDGVHGHNNVDDTVIFPHNIGLGAADREELVKEVGEAAAEEIRATGIPWTFAPTLGIVYSERWGRFYECFSEDPERVSRLGAAYVEGLQGSEADGNLFSYNKAAATAKHYIGEGQTKDGINQGDVEMTEEEFDLLLSEGGLLDPYRSAIDAGARILMASYNSVDGVKCHGNKHLLTGILKEEASEGNPMGLGFTGFVVSDYNGIAQLPGTDYEAKVAMGLDAGVDMFMEPYAWREFIDAVIHGYENGTITGERIDDAVQRILRVKFEMGLFEEELEAQEELISLIGSEEHRETARKAVRESLTVLKNDPVSETGRTALEHLVQAGSVTLAGAKAKDVGAQCGGWTISWQGAQDEGGSKATSGTTIYEGFMEYSGEKEILYNVRGNISGSPDVIVVVAGEAPYAEGNGDRTPEELKLPEGDRNTIKNALRTGGEDTVKILLLMTGRPVALADYVDGFDAIVQAWLPGTEGGGIAELLLSEGYDFTATLPVTWPWYPQDITRKFTDSSKVLFPYGTGLRRDGTSIIPGGQTEIPLERPEAPSGQEAVTRAGGIDIDHYGGRLEGEYCNQSNGGFSSWNISVGNDEGIRYVEWDAREWGNAKWTAYFRQAGQYTVSARMKVEASGGDEFKFGITRDLTGDGVTDLTIDTRVTEGYEVVEIGNITVDETGLYGIKIMDGYSPGQARLKLDYLQFTLQEGTQTGEYDDSRDANSTDSDPLESEGTVLYEDRVKVYMTSTEKSGNRDWYQYPTEMANQISQKPSLDLTAVDSQEMTEIFIDPKREYQEILGFGTSLEESTIYNLSQLRPEVQDEFLRSLVDPAQGGMTLFRITIGTSDFTSRPFYTYYDASELTEENAVRADGELLPDWYNETGNGFSIEKDREYGIIDVIRKVQDLAEEYGVADEVKFFASSWTPPGWMKAETAASRSYDNNDLLIKGGVLRDEHIENLAVYYTRYLEEYARLGISIYGMTLQNEPMLEINYPSCGITGEQEGHLVKAIREAVGRSDILSEEQKKIKLWAFDHNPGDAYSYVSSILSVPGANEALDGIAFHDYGGSLTNMQTVLDQLLNQGEKRDQTVNLTERSVWGTAGADSILNYLRNSAVSYNSWVTMLDSNINYHQWVGTPDPTMFVRMAGSDNDYWATPEFYITGQFSRFIRPGYIRVDSDYGSTDTVTNAVFKNPETNELTAVVVNGTPERQDFKFIVDGMQIIGAVPPGHIATYVWEQPAQVQRTPQEWFEGAGYSEADPNLVSGEDGGISTQEEEAFVDYIIRAGDPGSYQIQMDVKTPEEGRNISVWQDGILSGEAEAAASEDGASAVIQIPAFLHTGGLQRIRVLLPGSVELLRLRVVPVPDLHKVPGWIDGAGYFTADGSCTVENESELGYMSSGSEVFYKIKVPEDDTYRFALYAATPETSSPCGFVLRLDGTGEEHTIASMVNNVEWSPGGFEVSGSWDTYVPTTTEIALSQGEHILGIKIEEPIKLSGFSIGAYAKVSAEEPIIEEQEDGKRVHVQLVDGTLPEGEYCTITNLPVGVSAETERLSPSSFVITLRGNRVVDYDRDCIVGLAIQTVQDNTGNTYITENSFTIQAVKDDEVLILPEQDLGVPPELNQEKRIELRIEGGTFLEDMENLIEVSGEACNYYSLAGIRYRDQSSIEITLRYEAVFYRTENLEITVPPEAYSDSFQKGPLHISVPMEPGSSLPESLELSRDMGMVLSESMAYARRGSLASGVAAGNYLDYFLDVRDSGTYTITYTLHTLTDDGSSYPNAWEVNRGVPGSLGTNSYKQMSIPGLWLNTPVKMKQAVELLEGEQTLEFKAKSGGYQITEIEIRPVPVQEVSLNEGEIREIPAGEFYDAVNHHVIDQSTVNYTVAGSVFDYRLSVEKAGVYDLSVNYAVESSGNVSFEFQKIQGAESLELGSRSVVRTGSWSSYRDSEPLRISLPEGVYTLRLKVAGDGANLNSLKLTFLEEEIVEQRELTGISITSPPHRTLYRPGEPLELSGLEVTAIYNDGSSEVLNGGYQVTGFVPDVTGNQNVSVTYQGMSAFFEVTVEAEESSDLVRLELQSPPDKQIYQVNESFDPDGMIIAGVYADGRREIIREGYTVSGFDSSSPGDKTVVISFLGRSVVILISVEAENRPEPPSVPYPGVATNKASNKTERKMEWRKDEHGWWLATGEKAYAKSEWIQIDKIWYYFGADGYMAEGWIKPDGERWYWLNPGTGQMVENDWVFYEDNWYYLDFGGGLKTGWHQYKNQWYYLSIVKGDRYGAMLTGAVTPDGYLVNQDGIWTP